jgi:hypothetical protein
MVPKDGTTTCHRYCTTYFVSNEKPVTLAMTDIRNDEEEADAVERVLARVEMRWQWKIKANGIGVPASQAAAAG